LKWNIRNLKLRLCAFVHFKLFARAYQKMAMKAMSQGTKVVAR